MHGNTYRTNWLSLALALRPENKLGPFTHKTETPSASPRHREGYLAECGEPVAAGMLYTGYDTVSQG